MNKTEKLAVALLIAGLFLWMWKQPRPEPPPPVDPAGTNITATATNNTDIATTVVTAPTNTPAITEPVAHAPTQDEKIVSLKNDLLELQVSSHGGGILSATISKYRSSIEKDSGPVILDFNGHPALIYNNLPDSGPRSDYSITQSAEGNQVALTRKTDSGLTIERTFTLGEHYLVAVSDRFTNNGTEPVLLKRTHVDLGNQRSIEGTTAVRGMATMGVDTIGRGGADDVVHWAKAKKGGSISDHFHTTENRGRSGCGCSKPQLRQPLEARVFMDDNIKTEIDWLASKNKFFTQILIPEDGFNGFTIGATRKITEDEIANVPASWASVPEINGIQAAAYYAESTLEPGASASRSYRYYVGPKEYNTIKPLANDLEKVMEFGMLNWFCGKLLWLLNSIHSVIPNYGVAVILLTVLVRLVFWPIMKKSNQNMKRMQAIQPEMKAMQEKYKDKPNPQKMQQEQMALYKKHKVNPVLGCLPMVIQIPVFFALYRMLMVAVEMRYAEFLWISDLSEPEGMLYDMIPLPFGLTFSLNILPLFMTATMIWQQKLTPSAGAAEQQKMMMIMMPPMMLLICYNLPSALMLYWTTSQLLMIIQLKLTKDKKPEDKPEAADKPAKKKKK